MENKNSHILAKEFIEQFFKEFGEMEAKLPCKHRKKTDFEQSCDPCLVHILPQAVETFGAAFQILNAIEVFIEFTNFYVGTSEIFQENVVEKLLKSEKVKTPPDIINANIEQKKQMKICKKELLSNEFLNVKKFHFCAEETNGK